MLLHHLFTRNRLGHGKRPLHIRHALFQQPQIRFVFALEQSKWKRLHARRCKSFLHGLTLSDHADIRANFDELFYNLDISMATVVKL